MSRLLRKLISVIAGVAAFLGPVMFIVPWGCNDEPGWSWERCYTWIGTPALSLVDLGLDHKFDILIPLASGVIAGAVTWWLLELITGDRT